MKGFSCIVAVISTHHSACRSDTAPDAPSHRPDTSDTPRDTTSVSSAPWDRSGGDESPMLAPRQSSLRLPMGTCLTGSLPVDRGIPAGETRMGRTSPLPFPSPKRLPLLLRHLPPLHWPHRINRGLTHAIPSSIVVWLIPPEPRLSLRHTQSVPREKTRRDGWPRVEGRPHWRAALPAVNEKFPDIASRDHSCLQQSKSVSRRMSVPVRNMSPASQKNFR